MPTPGTSAAPRRRTPPVEPGSIAYPQATWTSFDRYDRYAEIARLVRSSLGPGAHRVLDVGDTAGYLALFEPELWVVGIDLTLEADRLDGNRPLLADGTRLPFPDGTFDAVVSSDVLEHVSPDQRPAFLTELRRVSRELVVVAAPFDTPGVAGAEELVRTYALLARGEPERFLDEHHENGLPDLEQAYADLVAGDRSGAVVGNGNLWDWVAAMLLRYQVESRPALDPLGRGFDRFHNAALAARPPRAPFYRHLLVSWVERAPDLVDDADPIDPFVGGQAADASGGGRGGSRGTAGDPGDLVALASVLVAADTSEVVRQDVNGMIAHQVLPPVAMVDAGVTALHERVGGFTELLIDVSGRVDHLVATVDALTAQLADTRARLDALAAEQSEVNGPLLRLKRAVRRLATRRRS